MAMTFGAYDFLQDRADMLNGVVPTDFAASYTDVEVAMAEGTIVLENERKGIKFSLQYTFTDGVTVSAATKLSNLLALRGFVDTLTKDNVVLTGVMLKSVNIQSRIGVILPFVSVGTPPENIVVTIGFHKVD